MNVVVNDLLTHYEVQGKGRTVVLLHGWGDNLKGLLGLQRKLAANFQVISVDLPGFGTTQAPTVAWNLDNYAAFVQAFLEKIEATPYALIGHSNGGAVAIRGVSLQVLHPEKLVLLAASGIRTNQSARRLVLKAAAKLGKAITFFLPARLKAKLQQKLYSAAGSDLLTVEHLQETFKQTVRQDVQADAASITLPTLLVYADQDQAVPLADGKTYNRLIKNSQLTVIEGAGHFLHLDKPDQVASAVEEFLQ